MNFELKKIFFAISYNACLFLILIVGIQNSTNKSKVNLFFDETVALPISFIIGTSFITGSIIGSLTSLNIDLKNNN